MKKTLFTTTLVLCACLLFAQSKIGLGVTASGSYINPQSPTHYSSLKNTLGWDIGMYVSKNATEKTGFISGLQYRSQPITITAGVVDGNSGYVHSIDLQHDRKFIVVPLKISHLLYRRNHMLGGVEFSFPLNYTSNWCEPNWIIGWGKNGKKLCWSVNYIQGFSEREIKKMMDSQILTTRYKSRMIQIKFSYPIWQK